MCELLLRHLDLRGCADTVGVRTLQFRFDPKLIDARCLSLCNELAHAIAFGAERRDTLIVRGENAPRCKHPRVRLDGSRDQTDDRRWS